MAEITTELSNIISAYRFNPPLTFDKFYELTGKKLTDGTGNIRNCAQLHGVLSPMQILKLNTDVFFNEIDVTQDDFILFKPDDEFIVCNNLDADEINKEWFDKFKRAFIMKFWGTEIGQDNPEYWKILTAYFFENELPLFTKALRTLIQNELGTTNTAISANSAESTQKTHSDSTGESLSRDRAGMTDTPQTNLNLDLDNVDYATSVNVADHTGKTNGVDQSLSEGDQHAQAQSKNNSVDPIAELVRIQNMQGLFDPFFEKTWYSPYRLWLGVHAMGYSFLNPQPCRPCEGGYYAL